MKKVMCFLVVCLTSTIVLGQKLNTAQKDSLQHWLSVMDKNDQKYRWQMMLGELDSLKIDSLKNLPDNLLWNRINSAMSFKIGFGKHVFDSLNKLQSNLDSLNYIKFVEIVNQFGYPSFERTGSSFGVVITIHLVGKKEFEELLPIFQRELHKGNMPANDFDSWYDRCQIFMSKQQLYGEYNKKYPCVADLVTTNFERKKIGLKKLKQNKCN